MLIKLSDDMQHAVECVVRQKMADSVVLDVATTAEQIRLHFVDRNVAYEDIVSSVARFAATCGHPVQFSAAPNRRAD